jgi:hypothetical protein
MRTCSSSWLIWSTSSRTLSIGWWPRWIPRPASPRASSISASRSAVVVAVVVAADPPGPPSPPSGRFAGSAASSVVLDSVELSDSVQVALAPQLRVEASIEVDPVGDAEVGRRKQVVAQVGRHVREVPRHAGQRVEHVLERLVARLVGARLLGRDHGVERRPEARHAGAQVPVVRVRQDHQGEVLRQRRQGAGDVGMRTPGRDRRGDRRDVVGGGPRRSATSGATASRIWKWIRVP